MTALLNRLAALRASGKARVATLAALAAAIAADLARRGTR